MTGKHDKPGAPMTIGPAPAELVVADAGNYDAADGCRIVLIGDNVLFQVAFGNAEAEMSLAIHDLLAAIGKYNQKVGS